ncbi:MAG: glycosyl hydrolase-related protein [Clostridia bacterium]|nr:glycosyl hydrolase-related protein [Clostridia bacterium]
MSKEFPYPDKNSERKLLFARSGRIKEILESRIFTDSVETEDFLFRDGQSTIKEINSGEWRRFGKNEYWGYREQYCWFKHKVKIPAAFKDKKVVYYVEITSSAEQFIIYVNGKITQGLDSNHKYIFLTDCADGTEEYDIALSAYCDDWNFRGETRLLATLKTFDDDASTLYYDFDVLCGAADCLDTDDIARVEIVKAMNEAANILELNTPDDEIYRDSLKKASAYLHKTVFGAKHPALISCIGHTHIDTAYLWRVRQTRDKAGRSFATVLNLMREYPEYRFMSPQAQLYDFVKQDYPDLYEEIKQAVRDGKWEPEGSMWVESDTNLISGESLIRQFMFGKRFFREEFGKDTKVMWLPDVFGYSGAVPQIMKKCGIDYFMTTKISWNEYTRFPYDTFTWEGIDGTGVLAHFEPCSNTDDKVEFYTTYNTDINPLFAVKSWHRYSNKDLNKNILCSFGHGDGGGGATRKMLENLKRLEQGVPGCPNTRQEFVRDFFDRLKNEVEGSRRLPKWRGELYMENHRGTLTSQARNKRCNRKSEIAYHDAETLSILANTLANAEYPADKINEAWKIILLNQFHDIIPGSAIYQVYEDSKAQYETVLKDAKNIKAAAMQALAAQINADENSVVVFNTLGFMRTETAQIILDGDYTVFDGEKEMPSQKTFDGNTVFLAENVPPKGYKVFRLKKGIPSVHNTVDADTRHACTPFYELEFDENMNISRLYHKESGREAAPGQVIARLAACEDRPYNREAWNIECYFDEKTWDINDVQSTKVIESGEVRTVVEVVRKFNQSVIRQYFVFRNDTPRIDIMYDIDWKEKNIAVKADYPVDVNTDRATFDIQFGNIQRTTTNNTLFDFAQFEVCGQKWADLSDNGFGLSVLNDCKYGWTVKDSHIRPTLLRSATAPNHAQDRERHIFIYSVYPHCAAVHESKVVQESFSLNVPLETVRAGGSAGKLPEEFSFVSCNRDNVIIETVKKAEDTDDIIIRLYETWNKKTDCEISFFTDIMQAYECNLIEENDEKISFEGKKIRLSFKPFEIKTLKIKMKEAIL